MKTRILLALLVVSFVFASLGESAWAQPDTSRRPAWTTSRITGAPEPPRPYVAERIFPSLVFDQPVELVAVPGSDRLVVLEVTGKIYSFENRPHDESLKAEPFADIRQRDPEFGRLYGLAFHPRFTENRYCFISYVLKNGTLDGSRVSRFKVANSDPPRLVPESEEVLIRWYAGGHNGAHLQFGPDGYLYISTGDSGNAFPPDGRQTGQSLDDLEASILRIDVDHRDDGLAYRIPPDNPFVGRPGARGEIWAIGLRNPWKMAFDPADGSLWAGDVGWELWEMIYRIERGANYGWSIVEGPQPVLTEHPPPPVPISPPAVAHSHTEARSITGGYVSLTPRLPGLRGAYVYGDYVTGKIWGLRHEGSQITWREELVDTPLQISSFGLDHAGDLLIVDHPSGTLHRLAENPRRGANDQFPRKLSETGLFADTTKLVPAAGVIPYRVTAQPWADGTTAERVVAIPGHARLGLYTKSNAQLGFLAGEWAYPDGSVLAKTVSVEWEPGNPASRRRIETQVLHFDVDTWKAYNYIWNDEQTDAMLAPDVPSERSIRQNDQLTWLHASRTQCLLCHTTRVGSILGFRPQNLPELEELDHLGLFAESPRPRVRWPDPHDETAPLEDRARAYLHINCGHCHTRGGGGSSFFDVQFHLPLERTSLIGSRPTQGTFGIAGAEIIAPGDPYRSVLYYRMSKLGHGRMPQFGSQEVDLRGTDLIRRWVLSLAPTDDSAKRIATQRIDEDRQAIQSHRVTDWPPRIGEETLARILATPSRALLLVDLFEAGAFAREERQLLVTRGYAHADPAIRDLFERFIPPGERVKRLGSAVNAASILALTGDAERGRAVFWQSGAQCKNCHKLGSEGQPLGPELTQIGKKLDKPKLLESILEPSKTIDPPFVPYLAETTGGEVVTGLLVRQTDAEVVLRKADGKDTILATGEIERLVPQQKSLMPELLLRDLTAQQVADLLAYLAEQK